MCNSPHPYDREDHNLYQSNSNDNDLDLSVTEDLGFQSLMTIKVRSHMHGAEAENWLQHKSLHVFTHTRLRSGAGAGAKPAPQELGPKPNFLRPLRNRALQTIFVLKKRQIRPRPLRVCVNIPAAAERACQNPPVSAPQPLRACVNVA